MRWWRKSTESVRDNTPVLARIDEAVDDLSGTVAELRQLVSELREERAARGNA